MSQDPQHSTTPQQGAPTSGGAVVVTAVFRPVPGRLEDVLGVLGPVVTSVHEEAGCELYALHTHPDGSVVMIEKWSSVELLDQHGSAPAVAALGPALDGLLAAPVEVTRLVPVPVGGPAGSL